MKYSRIEKAVFIDRPNRFIALVKLSGKEEMVHVRNTGRCKELLMPGCTVYVEKSNNPSRKTAFSLVAVEKKLGNGATIVVNIDSSAPNEVVYEWLCNGGYFKDISVIKREVIYNNSRFDFYIESGRRKVFAEVKGVTLENSGIVMFPDAPTERGVKHLEELSDCLGDGYEAMIIFVVQLEGAKYFTPNIKTHPQFANALKSAINRGVIALALECMVTADSLEINKAIDIVI